MTTTVFKRILFKFYISSMCNISAGQTELSLLVLLCETLQNSLTWPRAPLDQCICQRRKLPVDLNTLSSISLSQPE